MEILPAQTLPALVPTSRNHNPASGQGDKGYGRFRSCLRWEFGFTCAFCLLHEADFKPAGSIGVEGWGLTAIEHLETQRDAPGRALSYGNCVYICRRCNSSRSIRKSQDAQGRRLLDPTTTAWANHFDVRGDEVHPKPGDIHAEYTLEAYDLNDVLKVRLRAHRREEINYTLTELKAKRALIMRYTALAEKLADSEDAEKRAASVELLHFAHLAQKDAARLWQNLRRFLGVPEDADSSCACASSSVLKLPQWLQQQLITVEDKAHT